MGIISQIQRDVQSILNNTEEFGLPITLTATDSPETVLSTVGTVKKHHTEINELGLASRSRGNSINASVDVSTLSLDAANYPYRNADNRVDMKGHRVSWTDISGQCNYVVKEWFPNEVTGNIVLILGFYD